MTTSALESLRNSTVVVVDSGDLESVKQHAPRDATTNPSLILQAASDEKYTKLVNEELEKAEAKGKNVNEAIDALNVRFGFEILGLIEGRVSVEVDPRLSHNTEGTVERAKGLVKLFEEASVSRDRILIKIAATWDGIEAARCLEKEGIKCNLTLVFSLAQAMACAGASVTLISPFVGRITDWHKKKDGVEAYPAASDPGVESVRIIYNHFRKFGHKTQVMGASFRNAEQVKELCGCDLLTISPKLLGELAGDQEDVKVRLEDAKAQQMPLEPLTVASREVFNYLMGTDDCARELLDGGIESFSAAYLGLQAKVMTGMNIPPSPLA